MIGKPKKQNSNSCTPSVWWNGKTIRQSIICVILGIFLIGACLGLSSCSKKAKEVKTSDVKAVVTVDNYNITESDIKALVEPELERMAAKAPKLKSEFIQQYEKQLRQGAIDKLIREYLL